MASLTSDAQKGLVTELSLNRMLDLRVRFEVHGCSGLVQHYALSQDGTSSNGDAAHTNNLAILDQRAGQTEQATLAHAKVGTFALDDGIEVETGGRRVCPVDVDFGRLDEEGTMESVP